MAFRQPKPNRGTPMDDYLASLALFRKPMPPDGTSLFRAASDQIYSTQKFHAKLRECCMAYIDRRPEKFQDMTEVRACIHALAFLYRHDFLIYQEISKPPANVTNYGFPKKVILCESSGNHYDCIYPRSFQQKAAICQSLVYEMVYKGIFRMDIDVTAAVCLIRKQNYRYMYGQSMGPDAVPPELPSGSAPFVGQNYGQFNQPGMSRQMEVANLGMTFGDMKLQQDGDDGDTDGSDIDGDGRIHPPSYYLGAPATVLRRPAPPGYLDMVEGEEVLEKEREMAVNGPPFPYRVAKALDPVVYRNIEYDVWLEERKAQLRATNTAFKNGPFPLGSSCLVRLDDGRSYFGIVQEIDPSNETAIVYLQAFGEKQQVQMDRLQGCPRNPTERRGGQDERRDSRMRNRYPTWTQSSQPQEGQSGTSYSWPETVTPSGSWQPGPAPIQAPILTVPPSMPAAPRDPNGQNNQPILTPPSSANRPHHTAPLVITPSPIRYPLMVQGPITPVRPVAAPADLNLPWSPPMTPVNLPPPPVPQPQVCLPTMPASFPMMGMNRMPTAEDVRTLTQFYQLGGCEYFRQFLAGGVNFPRPPMMPQQFAQPVVIAQQQPVPNPYAAPMQFHSPPCQQPGPSDNK